MATPRKKLRALAQGELHTLAALCGGMALMLLVAVALSNTHAQFGNTTQAYAAPSSQTASILTCWLYGCSGGLYTPPIYSFGGPNVNYGGQGTLSWNTGFNNQSGQWYSCTLNGNPVNATGSMNIGAIYTTSQTYFLDCTEYYNTGQGRNVASVTVDSNPPPYGFIGAYPSSMVLGDTSTIGWYAPYADLCAISGPNIFLWDSYSGYPGCGNWHNYPQVSPSSPGVYTYSVLYYTPGTGWVTGPSATLTVTSTTTVVNKPTLTITGGGANPATMTLGDSISVAATYIPGAGDTLAKTAINDYANNLWCGTSTTCSTSQWTASPLGSKSYTFTPTLPGTYVFYPSAQTASYPAWDNYGKSLTVTVNDAATCSNGLDINTYPTCSCPSGQTQSGTLCVNQTINTCANGLDYAVYGPGCSCAVGQHVQGSVCVPDRGQVTGLLSANPARVHKGDSTNLSWTTSGMASCTLAQNGTVFNSNAPLTSGSYPSPAVTSATTFTLTCSDAVGPITSEASVTILPSYIEI